MFPCDLCQCSGVDIKKEMTRYRVGLASAPISGFMVTYNKHTLGLEDLGTLEEQNWLNDQVSKKTQDEGAGRVLSCPGETLSIARILPVRFNPAGTQIDLLFEGSSLVVMQYIFTRFDFSLLDH